MNNETTYEKFKTYRNLLNKMLSLAKKIYLKEKFSNVNSQTETWRLINGVMAKNRKVNSICLEINNQLVLDGKQIADTLSLYLKKCIAELFQENRVVIPSCHANRNFNTLTFLPIRNTELIIVIKKLKLNNKNNSTIPVKLLKLIAPDLAPILSQIFNNCITNGSFPECLKTGHIVPIHKKGDKTNKINYRPIIILHPFAKCFEKKIYTRLVCFFDKNNILCSEQYGFRSGKSIQDATLTFQHDIYTANQNNLKTGAIFIDFAKALERV